MNRIAVENHYFKETIINDKNFQLIKVPGDGNCFYHSLSETLYCNTKQSNLLRLMIAYYVKENWKHFERYAPELNRESYYRLHSENRTMATEVQLQAAADFLNIGIRIKFHDREVIYKSTRKQPFLYVVMRHTGPYDAGHFDPLLPREVFDLIYDEKWSINATCNTALGSNESSASTSEAGSNPAVAVQEGSGSGAGSRGSRGERPEAGSQAGTARVSAPASVPSRRTEHDTTSGAPASATVELQQKTADTQNEPKSISANWFPIKVKVNGKNLIAIIDDEIDYSLMPDFVWINYEETSVPICDKYKTRAKGISKCSIQLSGKMILSLPILVAKLPEGIDLILGKNFLSASKGNYIKTQDAYSFQHEHAFVVKSRAKIPVTEEWEILTIDEEKFSKLFKVKIKVDGFDLPTVCDSGSVRSIINSKYCTDKSKLQPARIRLRSANGTALPVEGIYRTPITIENCTVNHYVISAKLPSDIHMLIGNDFLYKYKSLISWATETLTLTIGDTTVTTKRLPDANESNTNTNFIQKTYLNKKQLDLCSAEKVVIAPGYCEMVSTEIDQTIFPCIVSPTAVLNNADVSAIECLMVSDTSLPIFNCGDTPIEIPKGTKLGTIFPENQNIKEDILTESTLGEIAYAVQNNFLVLEGMENDSPSIDCLTADKSTEDSIPSLDGADLDEAQKSEVRSLCLKYQEVFSPDMKPNAPIPNFLGHLERTNLGTIYRRQWPLSARQKAIARTEIEKFLKIGVVEEKESIVKLPLFVVEKRGSTAENPIGRLIFDSRALNKVLVKPQLRSYTISDILSYCSDKELLCTLDINHFFFNIALTEESKQLLGFTFENRSLRWARAPQGCSLSPQLSITALNQIMGDLDVRYYVDDIILGGKKFSDLLPLLEKVLIRLKKANLCVHPRKANLFKKELPIIGLIVRAGEYVKPNPERFKPLLALKEPRNTTELKSVLCFLSYYRRWISCFAVRTQKYHDMCNEKIPFQWRDENRKEIEEMYNYLLSNATLALFHEDRNTKLHCDASCHSLGAFLTQRNTNLYKPIAYFSSPIKGEKLSWSAFHKECLALYEAVKYFEDELRLLKKFTVVTDCTSLKYLMTMEAPKTPFDKFISFLSNFTFDFEFVPSEKNKVPDSLSRLPPPVDSKEEIKIPDSLITPLLNPAKTKATEKNQIIIQTHKVPVYCLPDGSEELDFDYIPDSSEPITSFTGNFEFLSNFHPATVILDNKEYPTVEHAFQAAKTINPHERNEVRNTPTPSEAKRLGQLVNIRPSWEQIKIRVMLNLLLQKFKRGSQLEKQLLQTGEREFIEGNWWCDMYWGTCYCRNHKRKTGKNILGKLLTIIRNLKRDCPELDLDFAEKENIVLAVTTRSKAKDTPIDHLSTNRESITKNQPAIDSVDRVNTHSHSEDGKLTSSDAMQTTAPREATSQQTTKYEKSCAQHDQPGPGENKADSYTEMSTKTTWKDKEILNSESTIKYFSDDFYFLSNYSPSQFSVDDEKFLSIEDALNTKGFRFSELTYVTPADGNLSKIAELRSKLLEATREAALEFFVKCLTAKFNENKGLQERLMSTENKLLVYCNKTCDNILGVCLCSHCKEHNNIVPLNILGVELMKLRSNLTDQKSLLRELNSSDEIPVIEKFIAFQKNDPELKKIIDTFSPEGKPTEKTETYKGIPKFTMKNGLLVTNTKLPRTVIPAVLLGKIFDSFHSIIGHIGRDVMSLAIRKFYYHRKLDEKISNYVNSCKECQEYKPSKERFGLLRRKVTKEIFHSLTSDFCHVYSKAHYKYCLLITDNFSNLTYLYPCVKADHVALQEGLNDFFSRFGRARFLSIDAGPQSKSLDFKDYAKRNGFKIITAASGAHMSIGRVESHVKKLVSVLRFLVDGKMSRLQTWHRYISLIQFHINNTPQIATNGMSPNEIVFGKTLETPLTIKTTLPTDTSIQRRAKMLDKIRKEVRIARDRAFRRYSHYYNRNRKDASFKRGEKVFVKIEKKASTTNPTKFQKFFREGTIKKRISKLVYLVTLKHKNGVIWKRRCHVSHLKRAFARNPELCNIGDVILYIVNGGVPLPQLN